ncbi:MAG: 16S rRNA (cytidine(1402)-2'-O)-methyltransferase [Candidatus Parcubacteria bacterium]|nr:16S rRNA (cytidine(1402)-2'-O)-methyltransferase [Candidatus Parcubacteria bacterium]
MLYIIATPIGNLEDITLRAIRILGEVDAILCEDTRMTAKLLQKYEIQKTLISYHAHSKLSKVEKVFELLEEGKNLALVSDAGTPCISDPGVMLVAQVREKFGNDVQVIPVPGPSAVISALSASGLPSSEFLFLGFLPHKKGRETLFKEISVSERTIAFYESPHRILKALESLQKFAPEKKIVIARELTKIYEEFISGTATEILAHFESHKDTIRGEFVVMVR